jgi:tRNA G18 (ribose-2'-O)-methylase SpoU
VIEPVADAADPRLGEYGGLTDVQLRGRRELAEGLFVAEGEKVIRRAVAAGYEPRSFLLAERWLAGMSEVITATDAPAYVGSADLLETITGYRVHRGALAIFGRRPVPTVAEVLREAQQVLVLEDLVDHTNVGLIFRSAAALGIDAVILAPRCADPLYRRAIKTSMGATLSLPYARLDDWHRGLSTIRDSGFAVLALTPDPAAEPIEAALRSVGQRVALVLGTEGAGLSARWLTTSDRLVRVRQRTEVDSLNVATAAAIACYLLAYR